MSELILRCEVSGNPCGTDTHAFGYPCQCRPCMASAIIAQLEARNAEKEEEKTQYQETCEYGLRLLCEAMGKHPDYYDSDQADIACYMDCFKDSAATITSLLAALKRLGSNDIVVENPDELEGGHFSRECLQRNLFERIELANKAYKEHGGEL